MIPTYKWKFLAQAWGRLQGQAMFMSRLSRRLHFPAHNLLMVIWYLDLLNYQKMELKKVVENWDELKKWLAIGLNTNFMKWLVTLNIKEISMNILLLISELYHPSLKSYSWVKKRIVAAVMIYHDNVLYAVFTICCECTVQVVHFWKSKAFIPNHCVKNPPY